MASKKGVKVRITPMTRAEVLKETDRVLKTAKDRRIMAKNITRHPVAQRKSPGVKKFESNAGPFNPVRSLDPIHVVSDGKGKWWSFEGATRVEACMESEKYGPNTKLRCRVYGNGKVVPLAVLWELFLVPNADRTPVPAAKQFEASAEARREDAVFARQMVGMMGTKFKSTTGVWNLVKRYGEEVTREAVDFVLGTWGKGNHTPMAILGAVAEIISRGEDQKEGFPKLIKRRYPLKKHTPDYWKMAGDNMRLKTDGKRESARAYVIKRLLGQTK